MSRKEKIEQVLKKIRALEQELEPLRREFNKLSIDEQEEVEAKVERVKRMKDKFTLDELLFAARTRCDCGAGLAYPEGIGPWGAWYCSDILLGRALPKNDPKSKNHIGSLPFSMYEIKSENQPSENGATTRPN